MMKIGQRFKKDFATGNVVEWLERRDCHRHGLGSKPSCAILLCPWERHFMALLLLSSL